MLPLRALIQFSQQQKTRGHRGLVILQGEWDWQYQIWQQWIKHSTQPNQKLPCLQIDQTTPTLNAPSALDPITRLPPQACRHLLGQEAAHAFFSLQSPAGIDLNALGIVAGLLTPGGLCFIGLPEQPHPNPTSKRLISFPHQLKDCHPGFYHHLQGSLDTFKTQALWLKPSEQSQPLIPVTSPASASSPPLASPDSPLAPTLPQQQVMAAVHRVAFGHRHRPLVLTADRGRGKSAALGMAAALCFLHGKTDIGLTASRKEQVQGVLKFCAHFLKLWSQTPEKMPQNLPKSPVLPKYFVLNTLIQDKNHLQIQDAQGQTITLQFYAPDALLTQSPKLDLLLVDEAASLPLPVLQEFLSRFARLVFSTTLHGYEGSGRGFGLRFAQLLQPYQWRHLEMIQPIRWAEHDPLEAWLNHLLLTPAQTPLNQPTEVQPVTNFTLEQLDPQALWQQPNTLQAVFELLASAHYQTQPNDLLQLLGTPHLKLWIAHQQEQVLGVLLALEEGDLPSPKPNQRFQGHLIPQQLFQQSHNPQWLQLKSWRIVRLAVAAEHQQQGLGTALVQSCLQQAKKENLQAVTTSFGATAELVKFWLKQSFSPLYLGLKKDHASASHALSMICPITADAQQLTEQQKALYRPQFAHLLSEPPFAQLSASLVSQIAQGLNYPSAAFPYGYLQGQPFEAVSWQLKLWALAHPRVLQQMPESFCQKVCQQHSWTSFTLPRKQLEQQWKKLIHRLA